MNGAPELDSSGGLLDHMCLFRRPSYLSPILVRLPNIKGYEAYLLPASRIQIDSSDLPL